MRRILKWLARMYPAAWRERYGAEYEALIEDAEPRTRDSLDVLCGAIKMRITARSFVRIVLPCALVGSLVAVAISFSGPAMYRSRTLVLVDTDDRQSIDKELMGRTQELLAPPILASVIQRENLYSSERARMPLGEVVDLMRKSIWIRPLAKNDGQPTLGFVFQFAYPDPHVAQRVDKELVSELIGAELRAAIANRSPDSPRTTFTVRDAADLPQKPFLPNRGEFGVVGVSAGLVAGLIAAAFFGSRRDALAIHDY